MRPNCLTKLLGIQEFRVIGINLELRKGREAMILDLKRVNRNFECEKCHRRTKMVHSSWMIEVQHLTLWQFLTFLRVRHHRLDCPTCGLSMELLPFVAEGARVSQSLASLVAELCKVMTVKAVAETLNFKQLNRMTKRVSVSSKFLQLEQGEQGPKGYGEGTITYTLPSK